MTNRQLSLLSKKVEKAMRDAVKRVIEEHKKTGVPLAIWKNNKVQKVAASKI